MNTSASILDEGEARGVGTPLTRPRPLESLLAAATRITSHKLSDRAGFTGLSKPEGWQNDAWDMYDLVGEQRFLANTLANRLAQARFFVGRLPDDPTEDVEPVEVDSLPYRVFDAMNGRGHSLNQIAARIGINLFIPGDGWLVGIPRTVDSDEGFLRDPAEGIGPLGSDPDGVDIEDLRWSFMALEEVSLASNGLIKMTGQNADPDREYDPDQVFLIRVWRPHPRHWQKADSPTRSSLPVLRELVGLTMHISAQVDSRLAGAGVLFVPQTADAALRAQLGMAENGEEASPFASALMDAMITPIGDRASASAVVPFMPVVPDDTIDKFRHMSFSSPLDAEARELRDEAIRRLALGEDCPPELLLGMGGMNHWGAWLVREDVVTTHLEPPLSLICDAITTQYLWTVLEAQGMRPEEYHQYVIWYDVDHMITRPSLTSDAKDLHDRRVISDGALRDAVGFDESDAPEESIEEDPAITMALSMATSTPSLIQNPGLPALVEQIRALYDSAAAPAPAAAPDIADVAVDVEEDTGEEPSGAEVGGPPNPEDSAGPEEAVRASGHILATPPEQRHLTEVSDEEGSHV